MTITEYGGNLSVLITTETGQDWQAFATWYSIYKNLPNAKIAITCARNSETPFHYFQWAKRINLPVLRHDPIDPKDEIASRLDAIDKALAGKIIQTPVLVVKPLIMIIDVLDSKLLQDMNSQNQIFDKDVWFLKKQNIQDTLNSYMLESNSMQIQENSLCAGEAMDLEDVAPIVSYSKGCGKWIDTLKGCPFSNATGLMTGNMTANENRIFDLWKKMCSLYSAII